jgi:uncharacterized membrane protein
MQSAMALLAQYRVTASVIAFVLVAIGWLLARSRQSTNLSAKSGGVVVGGSNQGTINTGSIGGTEKAGSSTADRIIALAGVIVVVVGVVVAMLAWWYPKTPA